MEVKIGPLARLNLSDLEGVFARGTVEDFEVWLWTHSARTRRRERQTLEGLVALSGLRVAGKSERVVDVWRPDIDEGTPPTGVLSARLVAAYLNDDPGIFSALVEAWVGFSAVDRGEVFRQLISAILVDQ